MKTIVMESVSASELDATINTLATNIEDLKGLIAKKPAPQQKGNEYLTIKTTANLLHVSTMTLHRWTSKKLITAKRVGSRVYYLRSDIEKALKDKA